MTRRRSYWPLLAAGAIALALLLTLLRAPDVGAHAVLERSLPVQNQELAEPPELIETWYSEPLEQPLTKLRVLDSASNDIDVGPTLFSDDPNYAAVAVPADLGPGVYTVAYQNVSTVDGHQWAGTFSFIILNEDGSRPTGSAVSVEGFSEGGQGFLPGIGDTTLRWMGLLAAAALLGATSFYLFVARPAAGFLGEEEQGRVQDASMALAADIAVMSAPILALSILGQVFLLADRLGGIETLDNILFDTRTGQLWLTRIGLTVALALLFVPALMSKSYRVSAQSGLVVTVALVGTLGLLMTYSLGSHADATGGQFWSVGSDFVHFAATGAWLGALLQLPLVFWWSRGRLDEPKRLLYMANVLDRFSWVAVISVVVLLGTGVFNGFVQLPTLESLWETTYGRVLIAKLLLIVPMLGVAGINALFLKPALVEAIDALHGDEATASGEQESGRLERRLSRVQNALPWTTAAEFALGAVVLVSVAILVQSTTADGELRQDAGDPSDERLIIGQSDTLDMDLLIEPFGLGLNTYTATLEAREGTLGEVLSVDLVASFNDPDAPPSAGRSGTRQTLDPTDDPGVWEAEAALLTQPGDWVVEAVVRRRSVDDERMIMNVRDVGGYLATAERPEGLFKLPFTFVGWDIAAGGAMIALGLGSFLIWRNRPSNWQAATSHSIALASLAGLIAGAVFIFGVDVHKAAESGAPSPIEPTRESLSQGQELFENNCMMCHGPTGEGDGPAAEGLAVQPPAYVDHIPFHNDGTLFSWITDGIEQDGVRNMPPFADRLSEDERWTLVTWLRQTFGSGEFDPVLPEDLADGG